MGVVALAFALSVFAPQTAVPPVRETLSSADREGYLIAARRAWVELDGAPGEDASAAAPIARCLADHLGQLTPLTAVSTKREAELLIRLHHRGAMTELTVLLQNGERLMTDFVLAREPAPCDVADKLAEKLLNGMRRARENLR